MTHQDTNGRLTCNDTDDRAFWLANGAPAHPDQVQFLSAINPETGDREVIVRFMSPNGAAYLRMLQEDLILKLDEAENDDDPQTVHVPVITPSDTPKGDAPPKLEDRPLPPV